MFDPRYHRVGYAILMLLGTLVVIGSLVPGGRRGWGARIAIAEFEGSAIAEAAEKYRLQFGVFPTGSVAQVSAALLGQNSMHMAFLQMPARSTNSSGQFVDPWGTPFTIAFPTASNIIVKSAGKDKVFETPDDIETNK